MSNLKIAKTIYPANRPKLSDWIREMRISQSSWYYGEGRERADKINSQLGVVPPPTFFEMLLGKESYEYRREQLLKERHLK